MKKLKDLNLVSHFLKVLSSPMGDEPKYQTAAKHSKSAKYYRYRFAV